MKWPGDNEGAAATNANPEKSANFIPVCVNASNRQFITKSIY